ncbi:hypothetical protein ACC848_41925, partial [Rhizobium johnstonii]
LRGLRHGGVADGTALQGGAGAQRQGGAGDQGDGSGASDFHGRRTTMRAPGSGHSVSADHRSAT